MRVLMVDDDAAYLSACATILRADCHDVVTCSNFNEGRRQLLEDHFDAIITDVRLGAYNGLHLIALCPPSMTKIAFSAFLDPVIRRDAEQAEAQFIEKPVDCASVSALLSRIDRAPAAQPGSTAALHARGERAPHDQRSRSN